MDTITTANISNTLSVGSSNRVDITSSAGISGPNLRVNGSVQTDDDVEAFGPMGTASQSGAGAVIIGHGWFAESDAPGIVLTDWPQGGTNDTLWIKYSPYFPSGISLQSLGWGNLKLGSIMSNGKQEGWQNWRIALDIQNGSDGAIRSSNGNVLFGLNYDGNFYWASIDTQTYTMILYHWGSLWINGGLTTYDDYDDLAIVKSITTKSITLNGKTKKVIDLKSLGLVNPDAESKSEISKTGLSDYYDFGKVQGLALGCLKKMAFKLEEHDSAYNALVDRLDLIEKRMAKKA